MNIKKFILIFVTIFFSLCCGCYEKEKTNTIIEEKKISIADFNKDDIKIENTLKLNFDNSIINIPKIDNVFLLEFKKRNYNKLELKDILTNNINKFSNEKIDDFSNLSFIYLDKNIQPYEDNINYNEGDLPDNFYKVAFENDNCSATYVNLSSFFNISSKNLNIDFNTDKNYFTEDTNKTIKEKANNNIIYIQNTYDDFFNCDYFEMFPFCYEVQENSFYFRYGVKYKNIPLDTSYYVSIDDSVESLNSANNFAEICISNDKLSYITSYYNWSVEEKEEYTELISLETACNILNNSISDEVLFNITKIDFIYKINEETKDSIITDWIGKPCYKFTIDNSGIAEYPRIAFLVDAVTGEIQTYQISL